MANNELQIRLVVKDELSKALKDAEKNTGKSSKNMQKSFTEIAAKMFIVVQAAKAMVKAFSLFIDAASKVQGLNVRLNVLFGSVEEGNKLFQEMRTLASQVPQEYDKIMESATTLASVVRGGADEVTKLMPLILDLSAATGISVQDTTSQMVRMYSSGAASADMFRERGVLAMLGFKAGVSVSAEETMDRVIAAWEDADSKFAGATQKLADTWDGKVSMMKDAWFDLRQEVGKAFIEDESVLFVMDKAIEKMKEAAQNAKIASEQELTLGERIANMFTTVIDSSISARIAIESMNAQIIYQMELMDDLGSVTVYGDQIQEISAANQQLAEQARAFDLINDRQQALKDKSKELEREYQRVARSMERAFSGAFSDALLGAKTAKEAFADLGKQLIKIIVDFMVQKVVAATIGKALESAATAASVANAAIVTAAWTPAATMVSLASFGSNAAPAIAGMTTASLAAMALTAVPAMAEGGIVPATPGGRLIRVAEGGQDEAIVPLRSGVGGITINIYEPRLTSESDIDDLAETMGFKIEEALRTGRG